MNDNANATVDPIAVPAKAKAAPKWDEKQVETLKAGYVAGDVSTVEALMVELDRSKRQVVGKLVSLGIYQKPEAPAKKVKDEGPTKGEILNSLDDAAENAGYGTDFSAGLQGATKPAILRVLELVESTNAN